MINLERLVELVRRVNKEGNCHTHQEKVYVQRRRCQDTTANTTYRTGWSIEQTPSKIAE